MAYAVTIVDDSEELRFLLAFFLQRRLGLACFAAGSLAEVQANPAAVLGSRIVILDVNLGADQPDGMAVREWLLNNGFNGEVCFLTGHALNTPQIRRVAETGARVLEKPLPPEELLRLVTEALGSPEERRCADG